MPITYDGLVDLDVARDEPCIATVDVARFLSIRDECATDLRLGRVLALRLSVINQEEAAMKRTRAAVRRSRPMTEPCTSSDGQRA